MSQERKPSLKETTRDILILDENTLGRDIIVGDIHGSLKPLMLLLKPLEKHDRVFFVGDLVDRGPPVKDEQGKDLVGDFEVIRTIIEHNAKYQKEHKKPQLYIARGNHESMFLDYFQYVLNNSKRPPPQADDSVNGNQWLEYLDLDHLKLIAALFQSLPYIIYVKGDALNENGCTPFLVLHADMPLSDRQLQKKIDLNDLSLSDADKHYVTWAREGNDTPLRLIRDAFSIPVFCGHYVGGGPRDETNHINVDVGTYKNHFIFGVIHQTRKCIIFSETTVNEDKVLNTTVNKSLKQIREETEALLAEQHHTRKAIRKLMLKQKQIIETTTDNQERKNSAIEAALNEHIKEIIGRYSSYDKASLKKYLTVELDLEQKKFQNKSTTEIKETKETKEIKNNSDGAAARKIVTAAINDNIYYLNTISDEMIAALNFTQLNDTITYLYNNWKDVDLRRITLFDKLGHHGLRLKNETRKAQFSVPKAMLERLCRLNDPPSRFIEYLCQCVRDFEKDFPALVAIPLYHFLKKNKNIDWINKFSGNNRNDILIEALILATNDVSTAEKIINLMDKDINKEQAKQIRSFLKKLCFHFSDHTKHEWVIHKLLNFLSPHFETGDLEIIKSISLKKLAPNETKEEKHDTRYDFIQNIQLALNDCKSGEDAKHLKSLFSTFLNRTESFKEILIIINKLITNKNQINCIAKQPPIKSSFFSKTKFFPWNNENITNPILYELIKLAQEKIIAVANKNNLRFDQLDKNVQDFLTADGKTLIAKLPKVKKASQIAPSS